MSRANQVAFPIPALNGTEYGMDCAGMTLREYAAIAAMQGFIARDVAQQFSALGYATYATEAADALLAALSTKAAP